MLVAGTAALRSLWRGGRQSNTVADTDPPRCRLGATALKSAFSAWNTSNWKSRRCLDLRVIACRGLGHVPSWTSLIWSRMHHKLHPGISELTQEFQPNAVLLRRDKRALNSWASPQTDDWLGERCLSGPKREAYPTLGEGFILPSVLGQELFLTTGSDEQQWPSSWLTSQTS